MSLSTPRTAPQSSESLEITQLLSPETLLANLRAAAEKSTSEAERSKFGALVVKLEDELARRSSTAVEGAKVATADLKSIMSSEDHTLAERAATLVK